MQTTQHIVDALRDGGSLLQESGLEYHLALTRAAATRLQEQEATIVELRQRLAEAHHALERSE